MNSRFTNGMSFYICDIDIVNSSVLFNQNVFGENIELYNLNHVDDAINIYYVGNIGTGVAAGVASFPWNPQPNNSIMIDINNFSLAPLTHEIGHYFGVLHTHQCTGGNQPPNDPDCPGELVDGSNSSYAGDMIIDTPADPGPQTLVFTNPSGYCTTNPSPCTQVTCFYNDGTGPFLDSNGDAYQPDVLNLMSYYISCYQPSRSFSEKQLELMEATLTTHPNRNFLVNSNPSYCNTASGGNIERYCELTGTSSLSGQKVTVTPLIPDCEVETNANGDYIPCELGLFMGTNIDFTVSPKLYDYPEVAYHKAVLGVTIWDMLLVKKHILGTQPFDTPYKVIAADVNNFGGITASDMVGIKKVILHIDEAFTFVNTGADASWRFFPTYYLNSSDDPTFSTAFFANPLTASWQGNIYPDYMDVLMGNLQNQDFANSDNWSFRAIKIGDVSCSTIELSSLTDTDISTRENGVQLIKKEINGCLRKGEKGEIVFTLSSEEELVAYQMGLKINAEKLRISNIKKGDHDYFDKDNFNQNDLILGELKTVWLNEKGESTPFLDKKTIFSIEVEALEDICNLSDLIQVDNELLSNLFYNLDGTLVSSTLSIELKSDKIDEVYNSQGVNVKVYPNPSTNQYTFELDLAKDAKTMITIYDCFGNSIVQELDCKKGKQIYTFLETKNLAKGLLYYTITTDTNTLNGKLLKVE